MKKILVIDDAEFILESTSTLLRFEGYDIATAPDGEIGVDLAFQLKPDLILCDIQMPKLDGYGVLDKIRNNPETATTPFIFLTAYTEKTKIRAGMDKGADDYLNKPYTREELLAAIDSQWNKHSRIEKQVQEKVDEVGRSVTYALPHEFRTALNEVINSAKFMQTGADFITPVEIKEFSDDIVHSANRLLKITENFLTFVMLDSYLSSPQNRIKLIQDRTEEPSAMLQDIASLKADKYQRIDDLLVGHLCYQISARISTERFHKIVDELLDNAFKFSVPGTKIIINTWLADKFFHASIKDSGRGMTNEQINNISALSQFDRTLYEQQGIGLGLVIVKKLVEIHDGTFEIESREGNGTTVKFSLLFNNQ